MTHEQLHNAIRRRLNELVVVPEEVPTQWDNVVLADADKIGKLWIQFTVLAGESFQASCGVNAVHRTPGIAVAQIFTPAGGGDKASLQMADKIKTAFRAISLPGIRFQTPTVRTIGRVGDEWQVNVECPFSSDDVS